MLSDFFLETTTGELLLALGILAGSLLAAWIAVGIMNGVLCMVTRRTRTSLDDLLLRALTAPVFLLVVLFGLYGALTGTQLLDPYQETLDKGFLVLALTLVVYTLNRVALALLAWYGQEIAPRATRSLDERTLPVVRRIVTVVIVVLGALTIVQALGLNISPVLAGLGIGGLAVALAVQPTLANLLAGAYAISEGRIGVGDYIRMQDGSEGVVHDIGWRTTKLRTPQDTLIVIPNARLADSVVTNYSAPGPGTVAVLQCGVAANGNIEALRDRVAAAVSAVLQRSPDAVLDTMPAVLFRGLTDGRADFDILLHLRSSAEEHETVTALVGELQGRFRTEQGGDGVRLIAYVPGGSVSRRP